MSTKSTSNATRASIICLTCDFKKTARTIADELNVKVKIVLKIVRQFRTSGQINAKRRGGANNATKLSAEMKSYLVQTVEEDCTVTLAEMKEKCMDRFNVSVSASTISRCLAGFYFTFKRLHSVPVRSLSQQLREETRSYATRISQILVARQRFFFVDETGFQVCNAIFLRSSKAQPKSCMSHNCSKIS